MNNPKNSTQNVYRELNLSKSVDENHTLIRIKKYIKITRQSILRLKITSDVKKGERKFFDCPFHFDSQQNEFSWKPKAASILVKF